MNISDITSGPATSPADLIDLHESLVPTDPGQPFVQWAFRGQSQSYGTLVPSIQRIFRQKRSVGAAEIIERDLIKTFGSTMPNLRTALLICPPRRPLKEDTISGV